MCFDRSTPTRQPNIDELIAKAERSDGEFTPTLFINAKDERALLLTENDGWNYVYTNDGKNQKVFEPQTAGCWVTSQEAAQTKVTATAYLSEMGFTPAAEREPVLLTETE